MLGGEVLMNMGLLVACYVYVLLIIVISGKMESILQISRKSSRKFLHAMIGNLPFVIPFFSYNSFPLNFPFLVAAPLKSRLDTAIRRLELQIHKLDQSSERFSQKDRALFTKIVDSYAKHDTAHANVYANELAEVRKMERLVMNARLALDQVLLRLRTVTEFGDLVSTLGPCISVLRSVNVGLCGVLPEAENELGDISNMLSGLMFDCGTSSGMSLNFNSVNEDASKILAEAATVAEQKINAKLPELPPGLSVNLPSEKTSTHKS